MIELAPLFQAVVDVMMQNRGAFNEADAYNANHGDNMVEIFELATRAAREKGGESLSSAMRDAADSLSRLEENGSAQVYANGLYAFGDQFAEGDIDLGDDLVRYVQVVLQYDENESGPVSTPASGETKSGDVLKALLAGLAGWQGMERGDSKTSLLDVSYLFDLGVSYMQAKARGGSKAEIIANAAVSVSPLDNVPHRAESGVLVIQTLLEAIQSS